MATNAINCAGRSPIPNGCGPARHGRKLTEEAAKDFADLAQRLRRRPPADQVAHFVNRVVFCMFAEDVGLFPIIFSPKDRSGMDRQDGVRAHVARQLFGVMTKGGLFRRRKH